MRALLPEHADLDAELTALGGRADRPPPSGRPWVMANMVMSVDGAYSVEGRSGGLSSDADREVFHRLRSATDAVLVAAGTARAERYRRPRTPDDRVDARRDAGQADHPRLVLVSRTLSLPDDLPLLEGPGLPEPLVLHPQESDTSAVPDGVELRAAGHHDVDLSAALGGLRDDGVQLLLCEGGPRLLGQLHALDLIDELFVTLSPNLVGGERTGLLGAAPATLRPYRLHRLLEADDFLLATYRRAR
jgi:riboflavin biosynthesis pyrimidine reductase